MRHSGPAATPRPSTSADTGGGAAGRGGLEVVDVLGRRDAVLADGDVPAGHHEARLDGRALAPGVYVVRLAAGGRSAPHLVTVVRYQGMPRHDGRLERAPRRHSLLGAPATPRRPR